jgi:SAM-dependent methyltransferase
VGVTLVPPSEIEGLIRCPRCGSSIERSGDLYRCTSDRCSAARGFPSVGSLPALIDFDVSIVVLDDLVAAETVPLTGQKTWAIERMPRRIQRWWKPPNEVAAQNIDELLTATERPVPLVLVVGGGTVGNGIGRLYNDPAVRLVGFDVYASPFVQFLADAHQIPLENESVDAVVVQAVLEHVLEPAQVVAEIHRVLRPEGIVYAETPFLQQVHSGAYDFTRFTLSGHRYLFGAFEELAAGPIDGPGTQLLWSVEHLTRALTRSELAGKLARGLLFWLRFLDRLVADESGADNASANFFLGRRAAHRINPAEVVAYYRGRQS